MYRNNYGMLKGGLILTIVLQVLVVIALFAIAMMFTNVTPNGPFGFLMEKINDDYDKFHEGVEKLRELYKSNIETEITVIPWIVGGIMVVVLGITSGALHNVRKASLTGRPIKRGLSILAGILALGTTLIGGILILFGTFSSPQPSPYERDFPRSPRSPRPRRDFDHDRRRDRWEDDRDRYERRRSRRYREDDYDDDYRDDYRRPYR